MESHAYDRRTTRSTISLRPTCCQLMVLIILAFPMDITHFLRLKLMAEEISQQLLTCTHLMANKLTNVTSYFELLFECLVFSDFDELSDLND